MNLKDKKGMFSWKVFYWLLAIAAVFLGSSFYYGKKINNLEKKCATGSGEENQAVEILKTNSGQFFDDRSVSEANNDLWRSVGGSPFKNYKEAKIVSGERVISLFSGETFYDALTGLVWSSPSDFTLNNKFTLENGKIIGGEAILFCQSLNKIKYAGFSNWRIPTQKELMQAYVNGASSVLVNRPFYLWSGTEFYGDKTRAWRMNLKAGDTTSSLKEKGSENSAICVAESE